uniref:Reg-5_1 protein n=1 Tax=Fopius arisanus TaxID=64838 RepID=A0A0C9RR87_9HYME
MELFPLTFRRSLDRNNGKDLLIGIYKCGLPLLHAVASGSEHNCLGEDSEDSGGPYLVGPMVIRVFPDGRPVPEDEHRPLPRDEDLDEFKNSVPSLAENERREIYKKPYGLLKRNSLVKSAQWPIFPPPNNYYRANPLFRTLRMPQTINTSIFRYSE